MNTRIFGRGGAMVAVLLALSAPAIANAQTFTVGPITTPARVDIYFAFNCITQQYELSFGYDAVSTCANDSVAAPTFADSIGTSAIPSFDVVAIVDFGQKGFLGFTDPASGFKPITGGIRKGVNPGYVTYNSEQLTPSQYENIIAPLAFQYASAVASSTVSDWPTYCQVIGWGSNVDWGYPLSTTVLNTSTDQVVAEASAQSLDITVHCRQ